MKIEPTMDLEQLGFLMSRERVSEAEVTKMRDMLCELFTGADTSQIPDKDWMVFLDVAADRELASSGTGSKK
jgi:hypothetical protein